jgi:hypothetical protein
MPKMLNEASQQPEEEKRVSTDTVALVFSITVVGKLVDEFNLILTVSVVVFLAILFCKFRQRSIQEVSIPPENRTTAETSLRAARKDLARLSNDLATVSHRVLTKLNSIECRYACPACLKKVNQFYFFKLIKTKNQFDDGAHIMCIIPFCQHTICINCIPFEPEAMDCPKCGEPYFSSEIELNEEFLNCRYQ